MFNDSRRQQLSGKAHGIFEGLAVAVQLAKQAGAQPELVKHLRRRPGIERGQRAIGDAGFNGPGDAVHNAVGTIAQSQAHGVRQVGDLGGKLDDQAFLLGAFSALFVHPALPVAHQALKTRRCFERKQAVDIGQIAPEVVFEQGLAVVFLRFEVVIERAFRHAGGLQQFVQTDAGEAFPGKNAETGVENMLARVVVTSVHGVGVCQ